MFICQVTGKVSEPGEKLHKVVAKTRPRVYTVMVRNEETYELEEIEIGFGSEIVRELNATAKGVAEWEMLNPQQRADLLEAIDNG